MKRAVFPLSILAALVLGFAGSHLVSTAQAQSEAPSSAVCQVISISANPDKKAEAWMNEQIAAGRTRFVTAGATFCAW